MMVEMEPNTGTHDVGEPGVGDRYRDARLRITALLEPVNDSAWDTPVDACTVVPDGRILFLSTSATVQEWEGDASFGMEAT